MNISENSLDMIEKWEGLRLDAYLDPVGIPTIGYGTIRYPNGQKVKLGDLLSEAQADAYLQLEVDGMVKELKKILTGIDLSQNQFDAVVSLSYNIGVGAFEGSSVLKNLISNDFKAAAAAFELWNKGTVDGIKKILPGLFSRRQEERDLFEKKTAQGTPIIIEESPQDKVTTLELYRDGDHTVIVALAKDKIIEILELKNVLTEDFVGIVRQYKNAALQVDGGGAIPAGERIEVLGEGAAIPQAEGKTPTLERALLKVGMRDDEPEITGSDIKELQQRLLELGYYARQIDGIFGKATDTAVKDFQAGCFGIGEADGKVGKKTWSKLWNNVPPAATLDNAPHAGSKSTDNYLLLTKTLSKDPSGCFKLKLDYFKAGKLTDSLLAVSGIPKCQFFRKGKDSQRRSFEPLPEGKWLLHDIEFADGKDNYYGKTFHDKGLGPVKIRLDYVPVSGTKRGDIEIHIDWNKTTAPGTAGCIGIGTIYDYKKLVGWLRETNPRDLYVDWGLGSV